MITQCDDSAIGIYAQDYAVIRKHYSKNVMASSIGKGGLNFIAGNNIINNDLGISLEDSNNEIVQNNIENCSNGAIFLDVTGWSQTVFHNNFVNNLKELSDDTYGKVEDLLSLLFLFGITVQAATIGAIILALT